MDLGPRRLNLSYVLHEPSHFATVREIADRGRSEERRTQRAAARLAALPDAALRGRIATLNEAVPEAPGSTARRAPAATVHLGPWWLLPRVLALVAPEAAPWTIHLIDQPAAPDARPAPLFRATARLSLPDPEGPAYPAWFAALALRPGGDSLLLRLVPLPGPTTAPDERDAALLAAAERAIRAHVEQWWCPGPLWDAPAETHLPEFTPG